MKKKKEKNVSDKDIFLDLTNKYGKPYKRHLEDI